MRKRQRTTEDLPDGLQRLPDGRLRIRFRSQYTDPGRVYSQRLPKDTPDALAFKILHQRRAEDLLGALQWHSDRRNESRRSWTFGEFAAEVYLPHVIADLKASTVKRYERELATIAPWFWDLHLDQITPRDVATFAVERKAEGVRARTVNIGIQQVRRVLQVAYELDFLAQPPPNFSRLRETDKREARWLSHEQADAVLATAEDAGDPWPALVLFLLHTGARFGEARNLTWEQVDWTTRMVHIVGTKNGKSRLVPLLPEVVDALDALPRTELPYVFTTTNWSRRKGETGRRLTQIPDYASSGRRRFPWDPPGQRVNPHMFRHTFATWRLQSGVGLAIVSALLGHASIQITADIYGHIQPESHAAEVARAHRPRLRVINGGE